MSKDFKRQEYARYKKLGTKWRRPRGKTSKMRRYEAGKPAMPSIGYRTPRVTRGLHPSGYKDVLVNNMKELECLLMNKDKYCAEIGKNVGAALRVKMLKKAKELGVDITNQKSQKVVRLEKKMKKTQ